MYLRAREQYLASGECQPPVACENRGLTPPARRATAFWAWGAIVLALVLQYALFRQYALREVVWSYPASHDQTFYLSISYDTYEHILNDGLFEGLKYGFSRRAPAGMVLHVQASLLYLILGPGRLSALTVNFLYFALLQGVLAWTLRWLSGRWSVALVGLGLLLCSLTPFFWAGSLIDFRIDFAAMCLFGVLLSLTVRSSLFASRGWSVVVGVTAAGLILVRFITVVYLTGVMGLFVALLVLRLGWPWRDPVSRRKEWRRLGHIGLAVVVVAVVAGPVLWWRADLLRSYYVIGHLTGEEKYIRVLMYGYDRLYYPRSLLRDHAGPTFVVVTVVSVLIAGALAVVRRWTALPASATPSQRHLLPPVGLTIAFTSLTLLVPMIVLTIDMHRSPVTGEIMLVPLVWLVMLVVAALAGSSDTGGRPRVEYSLAALVGVAFVMAGLTRVAQVGQHWKMTRERPNMEKLLALHDLIGQAMRDRGMQHAFALSTSNADYLTFEATEALVYERQGFYCSFESYLRQLSAVSEDQALAALGRSQVVVLAPPERVQTPFDQSMVQLLPRLRDYCETHLEHLQTFQVFGRDIAVYIRNNSAGRPGPKPGPGRPAAGTSVSRAD